PRYDKEEDEFCTPYVRWTGEAVGGVEIVATAFLNLVNGDWLRRSTWWVEMLLLLAIGLLVGGGLCRTGPLAACGIAISAAALLSLLGILLSYFTNYWFPWLVVAGGQVPCALAWALVAPSF